MRPVSHFQPTLQHDLRWCLILEYVMSFDLINKWEFPRCIYDSILVESHQKHVEVKCQMLTCFHNRQHQQTTTGDKVIPICVFPAKAGDTKNMSSISCNTELSKKGWKQLDWAPLCLQIKCWLFLSYFELLDLIPNINTDTLYKYCNNLLPSSFNNMFKTNAENHDYNTRNALNFEYPNNKLNFCYKSH